MGPIGGIRVIRGFGFPLGEIVARLENVNDGQ